jgi:hypothetical protein
MRSNLNSRIKMKTRMLITGSKGRIGSILRKDLDAYYNANDSMKYRPDRRGVVSSFSPLA